MNYKIKEYLYKILVFTHFLMCAFLYFGWISNNKTVLEILIITLTFTITMFYLCDGCIITRIERYLSKSDFTVFDMFLTNSNIKLTNKNRNRISLILFAISFIITIYKLFF